MEFVIPAAVAVGGGVGDALAVCCPENCVALALHQLQELFTGDGVLHGLIDLHGKPYFPALPSGSDPVLRLGGTGDRLLTLWLADGQAVADAERVRDLTELRQVRLFKVELSAGLEADGVDDEVGVDVLAVRVGGHDDLVVLPLLCQLQCDLMCQFRRDRFLRMEGLNEVIVHAAVVFSILQLGADELGAAGVCLAVHAGHQMAAVIGGLFLLHHVLEHRAHAAAGLTTGTVDSCDDGHVSHRPLQQRLERSLDVGVEGTGLLDIHGGDASHVGQGGELVEVVALGLQGFCEFRQRVDPDDLLADSAVGQVFGKAYTARFRLAVDALRVCLGHIKRQRNGFCSVGFLAHRVTSCLKSFRPLEVAPPEAVFRTSAELRATWSGCRASARRRCRRLCAAACRRA